MPVEIVIDVHGYLDSNSNLEKLFQSLAYQTTSIPRENVRVNFIPTAPREKAKLVVIVPAGTSFTRLKDHLERLPLTGSVNIIDHTEE